MIKYPQIFFFFLLQVVAACCFSQNTPLQFNHLNTTNGLSQNSVFSIVKDYKGFMWFATDEGLNKYDGYKFTVYKHDPEKPASISHNTIYNLLEDADRNLWVLTAGGMDRFDRLTESFIHYNTFFKDVVFNNIFQDSKKRIWLGSWTDGFCLFDVNTGKSKFFKNEDENSNSLSQDYVFKITEDNYGELWIGTRNGLNRFNPETEKFVQYHNEPGNPKSIGSGYIKTVYKDSRGNIWAGTQGSGAALYNRVDNSFTNYRHDPQNRKSICYNDILSFTEDAYNKLWIGSENGGISVFDYSTNQFENYQYSEEDPSSISGNSIYSLYKDDVGNIWAGTWSSGINLLPFFKGKFAHYKKIPYNNEGLTNNLVLSINGDNNNNVWIGTDGGGLNYFNSGTRQFINYQNNTGNKKSIFNNYVLTTTEYRPGILAIGYHRGGIDLFDIKKNMFTHYAPAEMHPNRLTSFSVNVLYKDRRNNLWMSNEGIGGIYLFDSSTKKFTSFFPDKANNKSIAGVSIFVMYETKAGQFWIGGDHGLDLFDRDKNEFYHHQHDEQNKQSISSNTVLSITEDKSGNLWIGTEYGLNYYDVQRDIFTYYTEKDGLPNNVIWGIQEDKHGNLWMSTNNGLSKFNPSKKTFRNYTISDGLQSNTFKLKASWQSPEGEMFFGGVNGFNSFYPDSIKDNNFVPPVYITGLQVFNKTVGIGGNSPLQQSVNEIKELIFSYKQSVFTIEFAALNFNHPEQNQYAYMLDGFDKEWNYVGNKRSATYTNLNPGTYYFKVKGSNNDGVWNETGTTIKIIIRPPFWLTWWFIVLLFIFISGSIIGLYRVRMTRIQQQKNLLEQKVKEQTVQLIHLNEEERNARLEAERARTESEIARKQVFLSNEELQAKNKELEQFAYVASHDLQEPLRTMTGMIGLLQKQYQGRLDEKADTYLNYVADASQRMKTLIKDLLDFSRIGTKATLESVDCNTALAEVLSDIMVAVKESGAVIHYSTLPIIKGYSTEIKLLFQNLIINAIKFRKQDTAPELSISAAFIDDYWLFSFKDNGIGIEEQYAKKIFEIFQRLHTRSAYAGSGIGLSHCKKIVEMHRGKIWVVSVPGSGSTFYFSIPLIQKP